MVNLPPFVSNPTVLVADPEPDTRTQLSSLLASSGYRVVEASDAQQLMAWCRSEQVDLVIFDVALPVTVGALLAGLGADPRLSGIAVLIVSPHTGPSEVAAALSAGAHDFLSKPWDRRELLARVAAAVRVKRGHDELRQRTAEVESQRGFLEALLDSLQEGIVACDEAGAITLVNTATSEELLDGTLQAEDFLERFELYQADGITPLTPGDTPLSRALAGEVVRGAELVIVPKDGGPRVLLANGRAIRRRDGKKLGAVVTLHDITERRAAESALAHRALHDPLCGLPNRILLQDRLRAALARAERGGPRPAVLFVDLDRFKDINDSFGHHRGDQVLRAVAQRLSNTVRPADTVARLGGDEFIVLAEQVAGIEEARVVANRLRDALGVPVDAGGKPISVTVSIGIALGVGGEETADDLLFRADAAMYLAKRRGRDRVEIEG